MIATRVSIFPEPLSFQLPDNIGKINNTPGGQMDSSGDEWWKIFRATVEESSMIPNTNILARGVRDLFVKTVQSWIWKICSHETKSKH